MRVAAPSSCLVALALPLAAAAEDAALTLVDAASVRVSVAAPAGGGYTVMELDTGRLSVATPQAGGGYQVLDLRDGGFTLITPIGPDTGLSQPFHR
jgi:hypothetical protein